jgi:hypothetical protein
MVTGKGLMNLSRTQIERDFDLIVGNRHSFCPWLAAKFLSTKLWSLRSADPPFILFSLTWQWSRYSDYNKQSFLCDINLS